MPTINSGLALLPTNELLQRRERYLALGLMAYVEECDRELAARASRMLGR